MSSWAKGVAADKIVLGLSRGQDAGGRSVVVRVALTKRLVGHLDRPNLTKAT